MALPRSDEGVRQEAYESKMRFCTLASVHVNLPLSSPPNVKANASASKVDRTSYLTHQLVMSIFVLSFLFFFFTLFLFLAFVCLCLLHSSKISGT